jgi:ABC-2 type transport system permease protein
MSASRRADAARRIYAVARRDLLVEISYHFKLIFFFTGAFVAAFLSYYVADLVSTAELLAEYDGTYFDFVIVGIAITSYSGLGVSSFNGVVSSETNSGTFEVIASGPGGMSSLLAGGFVVPFVLTTIEVGALIGIGVGGFGAGLTAGRVLASVPVMMLSLANFLALGIVSGAVLLLAKRGDPISGPVFQLTLLMSGAVFPVELFPPWLEALCRLTPAFYGVRGAREALLTDGGLSATFDELAILGMFAVVTLPLALWIFGRSVAAAKRLGVLGSY